MNKSKFNKKQKLNIFATVADTPRGRFHHVISHWEDNKDHTLDGQLGYAKLEKYRVETGKKPGIHHDAHERILKLSSTSRQHMHRSCVWTGYIDEGSKEANVAMAKKISKQFRDFYGSLGSVNLGSKAADKLLA